MKLSHSYKNLGPAFYQSVLPERPSQPKLLLWNDALAESLGLAELSHKADEAAEYFSGATIPDSAQPIALAYAGHQFGYFNPQLGDGRAHLLGEMESVDGRLFDLQLKGSGQTMFSRRGDGRCALKPAVREFIMSEALSALGVPTTRSLCVVTTGEPVYRERVNPGAVVTRVASSHIRVGTFEYFASRGDVESLSTLLDYAIERHYPQLDTQAENRAVQFLDEVMQRQIELACEWLRIGFIHGVMNTDNTTISGETIDFGPCAMIGVYDPKTVFSSIDEHGRYAFGNQPRIAHWNMARLAEALMALDAGGTQTEQYQALIDSFQSRFDQHYLATYRRKLGIIDAQPEDQSLVAQLLDLMAEQRLDYTQTFAALNDSLTNWLSGQAQKNSLPQVLHNWLAGWQQRLGTNADSLQQSLALMRSSNPVVIPRNHHVEAVLADCETSLTNTAVEQFLQVLRSPYSETEHTAKYQSLPEDGDAGYQTFCGT